jgi:dGTPase
VANLADEIAYSNHDLDDGLDSGLLNEKELERDVRHWKQAAQSIRQEHGLLPDECRRYFIIRCLIDAQIHDVVTTTESAIIASGVRSADDVRRQERPLVQFSAARAVLNAELRDYLYQNLYYNPQVHGPNLQAVHCLEALFACYLKNHAELGEQARRRARKVGWRRAICDYIAGMTDRYAILEHHRLCGGAPRSAAERDEASG